MPLITSAAWERQGDGDGRDDELPGRATAPLFTAPDDDDEGVGTEPLVYESRIAG